MWTKLDLSVAELRDGLKAVRSLTEGLTDAELEAMAGLTTAEQVPSDALLVEEDDVARDIIIIKKGTASVEMKLKPGSSAMGQIGKIRDDSVIGEFSFIDASRRSANVKTLLDSTIYRLPYDQLQALCDANHELGYKLMKNLAKLMSLRLRNTNFELRAYLYL